MGKQVTFYVFVAILAFLFLAYFKGFRSDVGVLGSNIRDLVLNLQGRSNNGAISPYPVG